MRLPSLRVSLASRFTLTFGVMIFLMFVVGGLVVVNHLEATRREEAKLRASGLARSLSVICHPYLMSYDYVTLQQIADDALQEPGLMRVVILDKEGLIAGYSNERERVGQQSDDPSWLRGRMSQEPLDIERRERDGSPTLERVQPVVGSWDGTRWGTVCLSLSLQSVIDEAHSARIVVLQFLVAGILLAVAASHLLARRITRPLGLLVRHASGLAEGDRDPDFRIQTGDEIEVLGERFREAAESLEDQKEQLVVARDELASLNATLEEKVRERTRELVESREKYRLLVDTSPDPLCLIQEGCFRFVNRAFCETFGYTEEQVAEQGFTIERVVHPDFARVALEVLKSAEKNDETIDTDWVGIGRGGRSLDFSVRGRRVTYQGASAVELLLIDLTDKKRLMRKVVHHERLRGIGEMTAMVAHNFNNLLAVILGRTQLIQERSDDPMVRKGLEIIRTSALQGGEIVRRVQDYTSDTTDMQFQEIHIASLMRDVATYLENYWRMTRDSGSGPVSIDLDISPVPPVLGSEALLTDLFKHIFFNAAESMPSGGTIRTVVKMDGGSAVVLIQDSGEGLTREARRRAFDPFFSTKGPRHRGLGLSASYGIIQRHRGKIELIDIERGGTSVEILLPIHHAVIDQATARDSSVVVLSEEQDKARQLRQRIAGNSEKRTEEGSPRAGEDAEAA